MMGRREKRPRDRKMIEKKLLRVVHGLGKCSEMKLSSLQYSELPIGNFHCQVLITVMINKRVPPVRLKSPFDL